MGSFQVKPLDSIEKWHGKSSKEMVSPPIYIEAYINPLTSQYDIDMLEDRRKELEGKLGVSLDLTFTPGKVHPFFGVRRGKVRLDDSTNAFDSSVMIEEIQIAILKRHPLIAPSKEAWEKGHCPNALFYIFSEEEDSKKAASTFQIRSEAYDLAKKLSDQNILDLVHVLAQKVLTNYDKDVLNGEIQKLIDRDPGEFVLYASMEPQELKIRSTVSTALQKHAIYEKDGVYKFGDITVGFDVPSLIKKFYDDRALYLRLEDALMKRKIQTVSETVSKLKVSKDDSERNDLPVPPEKESDGFEDDENFFKSGS